MFLFSDNFKSDKAENKVKQILEKKILSIAQKVFNFYFKCFTDEKVTVAECFNNIFFCPLSAACCKAKFAKRGQIYKCSESN
jgi:hypothetical protein